MTMPTERRYSDTWIGSMKQWVPLIVTVCGLVGAVAITTETVKETKVKVGDHDKAISQLNMAIHDIQEIVGVLEERSKQQANSMRDIKEDVSETSKDIKELLRRVR